MKFNLFFVLGSFLALSCRLDIPNKATPNAFQKPCETTYGDQLLEAALAFEATSPFIEKNMNPSFDELLQTLDTCFRQQSDYLLVIFLVFEKQCFYRLSHFPSYERTNLHDIPLKTGARVLFNTLFSNEKKSMGEINEFYSDINPFSLVEHSAFKNHPLLKTIHAKNKQLHLKHYPKVPL